MMGDKTDDLSMSVALPERTFRAKGKLRYSGPGEFDGQCCGHSSMVEPLPSKQKTRGSIPPVRSINYTWPGRLHLIKNAELLYATVWIFGRRFHYSRTVRNARGRLTPIGPQCRTVEVSS